MKAKEKKFLHFLEGSDKHFVIPVYQRNYNWKKEQCKQLFDDLIDISETNRTHFLGSIVSIYHDDGEDREYLIIDGQQRLTTLSLLLLAIYKIIDKNLLETSVNEEQIRDEYLINKYSKDDKKIRLKPVKNDKDAFSSLFLEEEEYMQDTNITLNYQYFYSRILNKEISIDKLFLAIKQLVIVEIELKNGEDDPQLIFESLNSTGLELSEADKVRNFILMKENSTVQEKFYNEYWNKIEKNTNFNVSSFIRAYLTLKERIIPNKSKVYIHFKRYVYENINNIEELLIDLLKFSNYYKRIINHTNNTDKIDIKLNQINKLESVVSYPFIMEIFNDRDNQIISENDVIYILDIIVTFVFRRLICEVPTNALNKIFMVLGKEIKKQQDYKENYLEIFKGILIKKRLSQRLPDDEEFTSKFVKKDVYNFKSKNKLFLLEQLENFQNKERVNIDNLVNEGVLNIEHIMPQTLTSIWREDLGDNYESVYEKYLHTIGNLTLTGYNSKMSNKSFDDKKNMEKGFLESRLYLNSFLKNIDTWNEANINQRALELKDKALEIWSYPNSSYEFEHDKLKLFTLGDDDKNICSTLYELDQVQFKQIIIENNYNYRSAVETDSYKLNDIYLYVNLNIESFLSKLRVIIIKMGLNLDDVSFNIE